MSTFEATGPLKRRESPVRRVNPSGLVVWVARWTDATGRRRVGYRSADFQIPGSYQQKGPCDERGQTCCAVHAMETCYRLNAKYGPKSGFPRVTAAPEDGGEWVYVAQAITSGFVKIGYSRTPAARLQGLQTATGDDLRLVALLPGSRSLERALHRKCSDLRRRGEWFDGDALSRIVTLLDDLTGDS